MHQMPFESPLSLNGLKLFLLGFLTLFLELALIRYLAGNIWNMGYFPNLVLVAVFIGMGVGFILSHYVSSKTEAVLFQFSIFLLLSLICFVYYKHPKIPGFGTQSAEVANELFFTNILTDTEEAGYLPIVVCFFMLIVIFALIAQRAARLFQFFKPLTAYSLDICGSCAGILLFMLLSWLTLRPAVWFGVFMLAYLLTINAHWRLRLLSFVIGIVIVFFAFLQDSRLTEYTQYAGNLQLWWSPYQKVSKLDGMILVNDIGYQRIEHDKQMLDIYSASFSSRAREEGAPPYGHILIIGSGTGNDVAAALMSQEGVKHIDAVEIDPVIARIGLEYHPFKPYNDPRVNLIVDDGRAFMTRTNQKYDLIIFALTDSLIKVSSLSQLRLENYLFTVESIKRAYSLLNDGGDIIFYNFYRRPWVIDKIRDMTYEATRRPLEVIVEPKEPVYFAVLRVKKTSSQNSFSSFKKSEYEMPTDDWPFLYLKNRGTPSIYVKSLLVLGSLVALLVIVMHKATRHNEQYGSREALLIKMAFIFMGAAFMLLETKSVVQFSLLFGTTWINNSLVFLGILSLVLAANWTASLVNLDGKLWLIYLLLLASSLTSLFYPLGNLLNVESGLVRFMYATLLTFSPIYFANLIFSVTFKNQKIAAHLFGWNLIGATIGGMAEYSSMTLGYNMLSLIVAACYTAVFILLMMATRMKKKELISAE